MGPRGDGWHDLEIRFANGAGGAGPYRNANGWAQPGFGFGFASTVNTSLPLGWYGQNFVIPSASTTPRDGAVRYATGPAGGMGTLVTAGTGLVAFTGTVGADAPVVVEGGLLRLGGNGTGSAVNVPSFTVNSGGILVLDNSSGVVGGAGRIGNDAGLTLAGGTLIQLGSATAVVAENVGPITLNPASADRGGGNLILSAPSGPFPVGLQADSLIRNPGATVSFGSAGADLDASFNTIKFDGGTPGFVGGILPYATVGRDDNLDGVLETLDLVADLDAAAGITIGKLAAYGASNVKVTASTALSGTINALLIAGNGIVIDTAGGLTVGSGQVVNTGGSNVLGADVIDFGTAEPLFFVEPAATLTVSGGLTGSGALPRNGWVRWCCPATTAASAAPSRSARERSGPSTQRAGRHHVRHGGEHRRGAGVAGRQRGGRGPDVVRLRDQPGGRAARVSGASGLGGNVTLGAGTVVIGVNAGTLSLAGQIKTADVNQTAVSLTKTGPGTLVMGGSTANRYTGTTTVSEGTLELAKSAGPAIAGPLVINDMVGTATVTYTGSAADQINALKNYASEADDTNNTVNSWILSGGSWANTNNGTLYWQLDSNLTEAGDDNSNLATWLIVGSSAANTDNGVLYWSYTAPGTFPGTGTVVLYKDSAKTQIVAQGTGTVPSGSGTVTITLAQQNGSWLSGTVVVSFNAATDNDAANTLTLSNATVSLYKNSAGGAGNLVAQGGGTPYSGTIVLAPQNDSGLFGSVFLTATGVSDTNLAANLITLDNQTVWVNAGGTLDLNNLSDTIGHLVMTGGEVKTGTGTLTLGGDLNYDFGAAAAINGKLDLGAAGRTFAVQDGASLYDLTVNAVITAATTGSQGITKTGAGVLRLTNSGNTYDGGTNLNGGVLAVGHNSAPSTSGTLTLTAGTLWADGGDRTIARAVSLAGNVTLGGRRDYGGTYDLVLTATNTMTAARTLTVDDPDSLVTISGALAGAFALTKAGFGKLILAGNNTYTGGTTVSAGILNAQHSNALGIGGATGAGVIVSVAGLAQLQIEGNGLNISNKTLLLNAPNPVGYTSGYLNDWTGAVRGVATWTEAGDAGNALSLWTVNGASTTNTDNGVLYWKLDVSGSTATVSWYRDSAGADLVAQGSGPAGLDHQAHCAEPFRAVGLGPRRVRRGRRRYGG